MSISDHFAKKKSMTDLVEFYEKHDGAQLCKTFDARCEEVRPLIEFKRAGSIQAFTELYQPGGDRGWIIDHNKSKTIYRTSDSWIAFAEIHSGPSCLTIFQDGERAGKVFYVCPQPEFNILRPIANSFSALLDRMAQDIPAFLRLVRARVSLRGLDGWNYGLAPVEYLPKRPTRSTRRRKRGRF